MASHYKEQSESLRLCSTKLAYYIISISEWMNEKKKQTENQNWSQAAFHYWPHSLLEQNEKHV